MKSECWACGNYASMPLSFRHWCRDCECDAADAAKLHASKDNILISDEDYPA